MGGTIFSHISKIRAGITTNWLRRARYGRGNRAVVKFMWDKTASCQRDNQKHQAKCFITRFITWKYFPFLCLCICFHKGISCCPFFPFFNLCFICFFVSQRGRWTDPRRSCSGFRERSLWRDGIASLVSLSTEAGRRSGVYLGNARIEAGIHRGWDTRTSHNALDGGKKPGEPGGNPEGGLKMWSGALHFEISNIKFGMKRSRWSYGGFLDSHT